MSLLGTQTYINSHIRISLQTPRREMRINSSIMDIGQST